MVRVASQTPHLFQRDVNKVVDAVLDKIVAALARGDRVELRGFGTFGTKVREGRVGQILRRELQFTYLKRNSVFQAGPRNPKTFEPRRGEPRRTGVIDGDLFPLLHQSMRS